ncbi:MAG: 30S ribosomal protein S16 [Thermoleophilia bacterium]
MVKIRLSRVGRNKTPIYRIVVADSRSPRDGKVIESIEIDETKARDWLAKGAQPTQTVSRLMAIKGIS